MNHVMNHVIDHSQNALFEPIRLGALELPNRIVMAPLTRCRASEGRVPNDLMREYYVQRTGAGLIFTEATSVTPLGVGYPDTPGIWSSEQVAGWKKITDAVHEAGGRIVLQLWHVGRISHPLYLEGSLPVAPSAIGAAGHVSLLRPKQPYPTPRALERDEIPQVIEAYRQGAQNALAAGFDGVEIHGANGYLPDQFLRDGTNQRPDDYGGSVENRARFLLEVTEAAIGVWGADRVGVHLSPRNGVHDVHDSDPARTFGYVAKQLGERGIAYLFTRESLGGGERFSPALKKAFGGPVIANEQFSREHAESVLQSGEADAIAWGQQFIANPDLPRRLQLNATLNEPNPNTFYLYEPGHPEQGYTDYPALDGAAAANATVESAIVELTEGRKSGLVEA
jgi:2,4-dienoyl-CoA reductase-like NADH-dependent reductase (Old Yellow Enzyme family)